MASLAKDLPAGVFRDGVITNQADASLGPEVPEDKPCQGGQRQAGPLGQGEDAVIAGGVALGEPSDRTQQVGDRTSARGEDGSYAEELSTNEGHRRAEGRLEQGEHRQRLAGYTEHKGLRVAEA